MQRAPGSNRRATPTGKRSLSAPLLPLVETRSTASPNFFHHRRNFRTTWNRPYHRRSFETAFPPRPQLLLQGTGGIRKRGGTRPYPHRVDSPPPKEPAHEIAASNNLRKGIDLKSEIAAAIQATDPQKRNRSNRYGPNWHVASEKAVRRHHAPRPVVGEACAGVRWPLRVRG